MPKLSAGILLYRITDRLEVFLVHPGGPFYTKKDVGVWSIPKGEYTDEDAVEAARREFQEETGYDPGGNLTYLGASKLKSGKVINCWTKEDNADTKNMSSNKFELEWPPKSGKKQFFPEVDKFEWFDVETALEKIHPAQMVFITTLCALLKIDR